MGKIIALDASTSCTGYAVFEDEQLVAYGKIKPKGDDWRDRIMDETLEIAALIREYHPRVIIAEDVPKKPGANTLQKLGAVHGMILSLCAGFRIKPMFILPTNWRHELGMFDGTRAGMKRDVMKEKAVHMANEQFGLDLQWISPTSSKNDDDVAEAVLIGWSYVINGQNHE
mgnify:CR=1 FL=1